MLFERRQSIPSSGQETVGLEFKTVCFALDDKRNLVTPNRYIRTYCTHTYNAYTEHVAHSPLDLILPLAIIVRQKL